MGTIVGNKDPWRLSDCWHTNGIRPSKGRRRPSWPWRAVTRLGMGSSQTPLSPACGWRPRPGMDPKRRRPSSARATSRSLSETVGRQSELRAAVFPSRIQAVEFSRGAAESAERGAGHPPSNVGNHSPDGDSPYVRAGRSFSAISAAPREPLPFSTAGRQPSAPPWGISAAESCSVVDQTSPRAPSPLRSG